MDGAEVLDSTDLDQEWAKVWMGGRDLAATALDLHMEEAKAGIPA